MHTQQPPRPDSPSNNILSSHLQSAPHNADSFNPGSQNVNTTHSVYNSMNNLHLATSEFAPLASQEHDALNFQPQTNGFSSAPYRTSTSFNPFPTRSRHPTAPFRDSTSTFGSAYPSSATDIYGTVPNGMSQLQSPTQQSGSFAYEPMQHSGRAHDFGSGPQSPGIAGGVSQGKPLSFGNMDPFRQSLDSALLQTHQTQQSQFQAPYVNGMSHALGHAHHGPLQNQSQFGSTLAANGVGSGPGAGQGSTLTGGPGMNHNGSTQAGQQQEEISTIFVVGFPEDMSEREFQNMFTFSSGFEAATLKIPNKEYTAYGTAGAPTGPRSGFQYPGSSDPYNIVTVNQGGVVVDGGRDGPTTSWPSAPLQGNDDGHFVQSNVPQAPRKQIIGFAKFRTRQEALEARDVLQGRRVDIERGSTLKAEMAKKNLHTKRGPGGGPLGMPSGVNGGANSMQPDPLATIPGLNSLAALGPAAGGEPLTQRDKDMGILGAMGIGLGQRRERQLDMRDDEDRERRRGELATVGAMGLGGLGTRGPRERAEEDERERKRKEAARLRQNSYAFEAFHSVPQQMVRQGANSLLSAESGVTLNGLGLSSPPMQSESLLNGSGQSPWGNLRDVGASAALRKMSMPGLLSTSSATTVGPRSSSPQQISPATLEVIASSAPLSASSNGNGSAISGNRSAPFSPQSNTSSLPARSRPFSPGGESPAQPGSGQSGVASSLPASSVSSASGSQSGREEDLSRSMAGLTVNTSQGNTSPQLPSPASGASSGSVTTGRNPGDQNPPINTLYVGNLPTSTVSGAFTFNFLEDRLRDLFLKQQGYRKLCFRQKSNGPMCFVEFEDVGYATKALNELHGHTLGGLVKGGGIRLSYSKNPLGVRTPTNGGPHLSQQQQQQQVTSGLAFMGDGFQSRQGDLESSRLVRRDTSGMTSPTSSYHYTTSPPPPRFVSPPPVSTPFGPTLAGAAAFPRTNLQGFSLAPGGTSTFSPFGISPSHSTIPDQPSADASNEQPNRMSPPSANIEASRAG